MAFSKAFPKTSDKSVYPRWVEIFLTESEERTVEEEARRENNHLMSQCLDDARQIMSENGLKPFQSDMVNIAISLFEKRASHTVFWKESLAKDKFDAKV